MEEPSGSLGEVGRSPPSPGGLRARRAHASGRAENWLFSDWNRDTPGQNMHGISKWQLMASSTSHGHELEASLVMESPSAV